jgi:SAM-dependent methyltransferase
MDLSALATEWTRVIAPRTGELRRELVEDAADFLGLPVDEAWRRLDGARDRLRDEWMQTVADPTDPDAVVRFYNHSDTELFELVEWHATDPIHYRTLILRDLALTRPGRQYLDYGSGIGNDALVFGDTGFEVTLADVSDVLLAFAAWRCRRRGIRVTTIDLKREALPRGAFDMVLCLDVLEHVLDPIRAVRTIRAALHDGGLLAMFAPFGTDEDRPMHVVHQDVVTPRMRSLGFQPIDCRFPTFVRAPFVYEKRAITVGRRLAYFLYDGYLRNGVGDRIAALYRTMARS